MRRVRHKDNRRFQIIELTPKGKQVMGVIKSKQREGLREMMRPLTDGMIERLLKTADTLIVYVEPFEKKKAKAAKRGA